VDDTCEFPDQEICGAVVKRLKHSRQSCNCSSSARGLTNWFVWSFTFDRFGRSAEVVEHFGQNPVRITDCADLHMMQYLGNGKASSGLEMILRRASSFDSPGGPNAEAQPRPLPLRPGPNLNYRTPMGGRS
ncbi:unnamed protein product, partial [Ectocarpus sp. 12 AP-2014]